MSSLSNTISVSAGGIDVVSIVQSLMTAEKMPLAAIQARQIGVQQQMDGIKSIKTEIETMNSQISAMLTNGLAKYTSTISSPTAVSVALSSTARAGSIAFTVDRLAASQGLRTSGTVASSTTAITTASRLAVSTTTRPIGATNVSTDQTVTAGNYTVSVTQATAGASIAGGGAVGASTVITGANNTLDITIDGVARTLTLAAGTYSPADLKNAVQTAIDSSGGGATASIDASNHMKLTTTHEGSAASLGITGGAALTALGFTVTIPAVLGVDGAVRVGTNPAVVVTSAGKGEVLTIDTGAGGNLNLTLGAGMRVGDAKVAVVSTGDRSLGAVAAAINGANVGASASAVRAADGAWLLQVNSSRTGSANSISLDGAAFSAVGGLLETSAAQDAQITIGTGPGAYSVTASGNTFTDILPGTTITATAQSLTPVSVTVGRDDTAIATSIEALVKEANTVIGLATKQTKYDAATKTVAPLAADSTIRSLPTQVRSAVTSMVGGTPGLLAADFGITSQKDGTLKFDKALFLSKLAADPDGAELLFNRHGSSTGGVNFAQATDGTAAGTYSVEVTTAATRATTGGILAGGSPGGQTIGVRVGTSVVSYIAAPGSSADSIASGLNAALARAGLNVTAELSGGAVRLTSTKFGYAGNFDVDETSSGTWTTKTGTDVQGKINGETAVGSGQRLSMLNLGKSPARGIAVDINEGLIGVLSPIEYQPGVAARLGNLASSLTGTLGSLTTSTGAYEAKYNAFNDQISKFAERLTRKEANYRRQWTAVQTALNSLQNQQSWLSSQLGQGSKTS